MVRRIKRILLLLSCMFFIISCSSASINKKEKISRYFTMGEAVDSSLAKRKKIKNIPNARQIRNIKYTAKRLDEARRILRRPLYITSWFRSNTLNRKARGVRTSAHKDGLAVDFLLKRGKAGWREYAILKKKMSSYDQLIYYPRRGHVHIGFRTKKSKERRQTLIIRK